MTDEPAFSQVGTFSVDELGIAHVTYPDDGE